MKSHPRAQDAAIAAALYAAVHRGNPGDVGFHARAAAGKERVVELGCGAGRVSIALAEAGHPVVGVDVDEALLAIGREAARAASAVARSRLSLREGDVRAVSREELGLAPDDRVEHAVLAHSTLYCLRDDDEVRATLEVARSLLVPGGTLSLDAYFADEFHDAMDPEAADPYEEVARVRVGDRTYRVLERSDWDRGAQRLVAHYRHVPLGGGRPIDTRIEHRYLLAAQLRALLEGEGFAIERFDGGFTGEPLGPGAEHVAVVARVSRDPTIR